jgi:hypothetical protein
MIQSFEFRSVGIECLALSTLIDVVDCSMTIDRTWLFVDNHEHEQKIPMNVNAFRVARTSVSVLMLLLLLLLSSIRAIQLNGTDKSSDISSMASKTRHIRLVEIHRTTFI